MAEALIIDDHEGCSHYRRFCKFWTPCCDSIYSCRFCHDEKESHELVRSRISKILCNICSRMQNVQGNCVECGITFGQYVCLKCRLFDNEAKGQFHCNDCGICRVGGRSNYFHCRICNLCLKIQLRDNHQCVENSSRGDCPVCVEDMHYSRKPCDVLSCGHLLHLECLETLKEAGMMFCPVCKKNL